MVSPTLTNPAYAGVTRYRPAHEKLEITRANVHEPVISSTLFARAKERVSTSGIPLPDRCRAKPLTLREKGISHRLTGSCPLCGWERHAWPSQVKNYRNGLNSVCRKCALSAGRAQTLQRNRELRLLRIEKRDFLHELALMVLRVINARPREFERPTVFSIARKRLGTLRWHDPRTRTYHRLAIDCTFEFMERCKARPEADHALTLADSILDRTTWIGDTPDAEGNHVWQRTLA